MSFQPFHKNTNKNPNFTSPPLKNTLLNSKATQSFNHMVLAMQLHSLTDPNSKTLIPNFDLTLPLSDEILLKILSKLPNSQTKSNSLVSKRWLNLQGRLIRSLKIFDLNFVLSEEEKKLLPVEAIDKGLKEVAKGCPNLRKLKVTGGSEEGLVTIGEECVTLMELELQKCNDDVLRGVAACRNLQVVKLIGCVDGFYESVVSDIGLTILAQGCKRLVKLELVGCEGSFDGIKAIGSCCLMLEELVFVDHRMDDGWLAGVSFCENLKTLRFVSCKVIDGNPGLEEHLGFCVALEELHFQKCQLRDKNAMGAVFSVCRAAKEVVLHDCWGLDDGVFGLAVVCRRVKLFDIEACSLLTTECLESVIESWKDLECLRVVNCKNIKDSDISPALANLFTILKELKWRPDTKHLLSSSLGEVNMGKRGGKFFRWT
ncbi:F-box protein At5g07670-like isoform X2 [Trifolium pratense]|uniref:Uncharacterized protein n=1 Tax=Trifolium pratense TaxID=57577 RepID=A0ACB0J352_TRIPR|nr:F-box protein At5g07670-like isoform X2 [Trifolium pratense]CAJ2638551.1 unnamed protein product [Trifolium pratense]